MGVQQTNLQAGSQKSFWHQCVQTVTRPVEWVRHVVLPAENPKLILDRINAAASKGIEKAKVAKSQVENRNAQIHNELNHLLAQRKIERALQIRPQTGPIANLPHSLADPNNEVTRVVELQEQVDRTDWTQEKKERLRKLIEKVSVFTALVQMRNWAGISESNNLKILALVKKATNGERISVWELFTNNYELGVIQKLYAGLFYWLFYMTSLINNTIDAYLGGFIEEITEDFRENNKARTQIFRALIENVNEFLQEDLKATEDYANGTVRGSLDFLQNAAIERHYGFNLKTLCEDFSANLLAGDPRVKFFKDFQKIPVLKFAFKSFEWLVNKLLIQRFMNWILPGVLEEVVKQGINATQPDKLPFAIALTQFFTAQLERLRTIDHDAPPSQTEEVAGTEWLPAAVKHLLKALKLEGKYTPFEMRKKIADFEKEGVIKDPVLPRLEKALIEAGNKLFSYLDETVQSGKFFADLLGLALAPFEGEEKTEEMLKAQYDQEYRIFKDTAASVFKTLVRKAISEEPSQAKREHRQMLVEESLDEKSIVTMKLFQKMDIISEEIERDVAAALRDPSKDYNIQTNIAEILQLMRILNSRKEFQSDSEEIDATNQNEIWRRFATLFERIETVQTQLLALQDSSDQYRRHTAVVEQFAKLKTALESPQNLTLLKEAATEITQLLGADAPISKNHLPPIIEQFSELVPVVIKEEHAVQAVSALYPTSGNGLLDQMRGYQRGNYPRGFKPRDCLNRIAQNLAFFNGDEKRRAEALIRNGSQIHERWEDIETLFNDIRDRHITLRDSYNQLLNQSLEQTREWIDSMMQSYNHMRSEDYEKMKERMRKISTEMKSLNKKASTISPSLTIPLSSTLLKGISLTVPTALGTFLGYPALGAFAGYSAFQCQQPAAASNEHWVRSSMKKVLPAAISALAPYSLSSLASYVGEGVNLPLNWEDWAKMGASLASGGFLGRATVDLGKSALETHTFNKVWDIFEQAYDFSLSPRIYKAASTRIMKVVANA